MYSSSYYRYNSNAAFLTSGIAIVIYIALIVLLFAAMWRIFTKAGEKGWKCLIPIYNTYIMWRIGWNTDKFWTLFVGSIIVSILSSIMVSLGRVGAIIGSILSIGWAVYSIYLSFKFAITMAHRFNKSTAFGVLGLVFFSIIGIPILGFGSADYDEARDMG